LNRARDIAFLAGEDVTKVTYQPACAEACPAKAIAFGNLLDGQSEVARLTKDPRAFRLLSKLHTEPKVYYLSRHKWIHLLADKGL
jgi:molybdopterin-containing oxidoreductase family iron-sulfur binding subunit